MNEARRPASEANCLRLKDTPAGRKGWQSAIEGRVCRGLAEVWWLYERTPPFKFRIRIAADVGQSAPLRNTEFDPTGTFVIVRVANGSKAPSNRPLPVSGSALKTRRHESRGLQFESCSQLTLFVFLSGDKRLERVFGRVDIYRKHCLQLGCLQLVPHSVPIVAPDSFQISIQFVESRARRTA
jgi:hypothetical protein